MRAKLQPSAEEWGGPRQPRPQRTTVPFRSALTCMNASLTMEPPLGVVVTSGDLGRGSGGDENVLSLGLVDLIVAGARLSSRPD